MKNFEFFIFTPAGHSDPSLAIAGSRAGGIGIFNAECEQNIDVTEQALEKLASHARHAFGIKLGQNIPAGLLDVLLLQYSSGLQWVIFDVDSAARYADWIQQYRDMGGRVLLEAVDTQTGPGASRRSAARRLKAVD